VSYGLVLLRKNRAGDDPAAAYEALEEDEELEVEPTAAEQEELRRLAADLQTASPGLDLVEGGPGFMLQLGYESERPVVIDIAGPDAITMMFSFGGDRADAALDEVESYLPVFERHGYVAYDPQLERLYSPQRDRAEALVIHRDVHEQLAEAYGKRPSWWKRLLGRS
jgi:hypothetical protein